MFKMSVQAIPVKPRRVSASKIANDNVETAMSSLSWREREEIKRRISDLQWQANYARIQLKSWNDLDNDRWTALKSMHEAAADELAELSGLYLD
ncbi:hypothetical protein ACJ3XI_05900 [Litorimonas sp. RW-G-Af-16]|uniref:hypothetical protein n=1 Tax=Litorimonas sp. RW-G-Af-16 TaxID=3241168 RepID=UPI00390C7475